MVDDVRPAQSSDTRSRVPSESGRTRDNAARAAGTFLLLTALTTLAAVAARVSADADQATLVESLVAISESKGLYGAGGAARIVSGITLIAAAWFLLQTWIIRLRLGAPVVPILFAASGLFTLVSGVCAVWLAVSVPDAAVTINAFAGTTSTEVAAELRWLTGKIGFAIAGLALVVAARYQWKAGGTLRRISPVSAIIGISMQFIWIDAATLVHRVSGIAFFLWLVAIGAMLCIGRVERHFAPMLHLPPESGAPEHQQHHNGGVGK